MRWFLPLFLLGCAVQPKETIEFGADVGVIVKEEPKDVAEEKEEDKRNVPKGEGAMKDKQDNKEDKKAIKEKETKKTVEEKESMEDKKTMKEEETMENRKETSEDKGAMGFVDCRSVQNASMAMGDRGDGLWELLSMTMAIEDEDMEKEPEDNLHFVYDKVRFKFELLPV